MAHRTSQPALSPALRDLVNVMVRSIVRDYLTPKSAPALENPAARSERVALQAPAKAA